jgi:hypothetical protein
MKERELSISYHRGFDFMDVMLKESVRNEALECGLRELTPELYDHK